MRLNRLTDAETATLAVQIKHVESSFVNSEQTRLLGLKDMFFTNAPYAVLQLQRFSEGVDWLYDRWGVVKDTIESTGEIVVVCQRS